MPDRTPKSKSIIVVKVPKTEDSVKEGIYSMTPSWRFNRADIQHAQWSIYEGIEEDVIEDKTAPGGTRLKYKFSPSICPELLDHLKTREITTWKDIMQQVGGPKSNTNSHFIDIKSLEHEAIERLKELKIEEDQIFSLRVDGQKRLFGFIDPIDGSMDVLWFDRDHSVCKATKRYS